MSTTTTNPEYVASSFDALAYEYNLSSRMRDLCRTFFLAGLRRGRVQNAAISSASDAAAEREAANESRHS